MSPEANPPEVNDHGRAMVRGLSDEQINQILSSLPRETASVDFTDRVIARIAGPQPDAQGSATPSRFSSLTTLMFGPRPGFGMLLAASAVMALVAGLAWSQFFGAASQNAPSATVVASSDDSQGDSALSPAVVRGTRVGTAAAGSSFDPPTLPNGSSAVGFSGPITESEKMQADYQRLQRQLMLLRQMQDSQSPVLEIGSNGDVRYVIDLSDYVTSEAPESEPPQF